MSHACEQEPPFKADCGQSNLAENIVEGKCRMPIIILPCTRMPHQIGQISANHGEKISPKDPDARVRGINFPKRRIHLN
jgi:hypothetical protein